MRSKLTTIILIGMVLGILVGYACHILWPDPKTAKTIADYISLFTDIFLRLIKMIIAPLVFSTLVVGVAHMGDTKAVGRIGGKAMVWFIGASLVSLLVGMILVNILRPGDNLNLPLPDAEASTNLKVASLSMKEFVAHLVPRSIVEAMATNEILQIVVFSLFFGVAMRSAWGANPQTGRRHRATFLRHPVDHRLCHGAGADRSVCVDGRDRDDPGPRHPRDLRQVRHRVLLRARSVVVPTDRRRIRDLWPP